MKIGIVSLDQVWENKDANMALCKDAVEEASNSNINLLIFPEMTLTGFTMNPGQITENINGSPTIDFFRTLAIEYHMGIVFGICLSESMGNTNCAVYLSKSGETGAIYRKIHPFTFAMEDKHFSAGNELGLFDFEGFKIGLTICYDLRFPELYRLYTDKCQIVINIANWPESRVDPWVTLLKARAIENQYIVIGVNRTGIDGNQVKYTESSIVYLPDGTIPKFSINENNLKVFEITPDLVPLFRQSFPVLQDRREELYKKLKVDVTK